jgi:hypothetical protein
VVIGVPTVVELGVEATVHDGVIWVTTTAVEPEVGSVESDSVVAPER